MIRSERNRQSRNILRFSNLTLPHQKVIVVNDKIGAERKADQAICRWLSEQYGEKVGQCGVNRLNESSPFLVMLVSKLERRFELNLLFKFIAKCRKDPNVTHLFVWVVESKLQHSFALPYFEHMADTVVTFEDSQHLSLVVKKPSGSVTNKYYEMYCPSERRRDDEFCVMEAKRPLQAKQQQSTAEAEPPINPATLGTFKIDLKEGELQAKNALTLPFEFFKTTPEGGKILYHPDAADDLDEEDPDDDLLI
ncbi:elongator complex protein 5 [Anopheles bellator]|uniref:elongator complex protein 5 n=1 Tax=Anopheles bellator TaxID=139047 RepID=UPI002649E3E0|nr:elongator complex protein 5 [Anopheles bellator]